jgi:peptidoglycan/xylan/chitin deacetylase (PgdA/CDA1 family)
MARQNRKSVALLLLTFVPAAVLVAVGLPWTGLAVLAVLHLAVLWGTLAPHSRLFGPVMRKLRTSQRDVWLTIDDGPSDDTPALLDLLDQYRARATFFLVGERAARRPELVQAIRSRGHEIGNHSATHPSAWFWALSPRRMAHEVGEAQRTLATLSGAPPRWFRAVVGHANPFVAPVLAEHGLTRVSWSARGYDGVSGDVERVVTRLLKGLKPGAIILLHEGRAHGHSTTIIRRVLEELRARDLRAVLPS